MSTVIYNKKTKTFARRDYEGLDPDLQDELKKERKKLADNYRYYKKGINSDINYRVGLAKERIDDYNKKKLSDRQKKLYNLLPGGNKMIQKDNTRKYFYDESNNLLKDPRKFLYDEQLSSLDHQKKSLREKAENKQRDRSPRRTIIWGG